MKNSVVILILFGLLFGSIHTSCNTDKLPEPTVGEECDAFDATYDGDIKAIIDASCALTGCHVTNGGGAPGSFEDFAGLSNYTNNAPNGFRDRVIVLVSDPENGMPPDYSSGPIDLTPEQLEIFKCWVDSGYPEN